MVNWDYAKLTKSVAEHGGVEVFCNDLRKEGFYSGLLQGRLQGGSITGIILLISAGVGTLIYKKHSRRKAELYEKAKSAELELSKIAIDNDNQADEISSKT